MDDVAGGFTIVVDVGSWGGGDDDGGDGGGDDDGGDVGGGDDDVSGVGDDDGVGCDELDKTDVELDKTDVELDKTEELKLVENGVRACVEVEVEISVGGQVGGDVSSPEPLPLPEPEYGSMLEPEPELTGGHCWTEHLHNTQNTASIAHDSNWVLELLCIMKRKRRKGAFHWTSLARLRKQPIRL